MPILMPSFPFRCSLSCHVLQESISQPAAVCLRNSFTKPGTHQELTRNLYRAKIFIPVVLSESKGACDRETSRRIPRIFLLPYCIREFSRSLPRALANFTS